MPKGVTSVEQALITDRGKLQGIERNRDMERHQMQSSLGQLIQVLTSRETNERLAQNGVGNTVARDHKDKDTDSVGRISGSKAAKAVQAFANAPTTETDAGKDVSAEVG